MEDDDDALNDREFLWLMRQAVEALKSPEVEAFIRDGHNGEKGDEKKKFVREPS